MADLFSLLVQTGNGLTAQSAAVATAGNNIANANTPGYSRQTVNLVANPSLGTLGANAVGMGVSLGSVTQARDQFIERQIPNALGTQSKSQAESDALSAVSALDPDLAGGLPNSLSAFYSSLRSLAQNPGDTALRQNAVGAAQTLARSFNQTSAALEDNRNGLDSQIQSKVGEINTAAKSLADLNKQIQISRTAGGEPNDLLDARQRVIDQLSSLTGATPYTNGSGDVSMALPGGMALVSDARAAQLSVLPDASNDGHLDLRITRADGSGPAALSGASLGGEMGGMFAARDGAMKTARTAIDTLAFDVGTAMNTIHSAGYAMDGTGSRNLFTLPATSTNAAAQITVNAAIVADPKLLAAASTTPAASGDNSNILALLGTETQALSGGSAPVATLQTIVSNFGSSAEQAKATADHDTAMSSHLANLRDSASGVSVDEEMINLTKAQRAFEAMSKVISTANDMLDTLMKLG